MEEAMAESDLPAVVAIAINSKGQRIEYVYGALNWGKSEPIKTSSIFRIHSMTKIVTSIAAMQLVEQGKLNWIRICLNCFQRWLKSQFCNKTGS